MAGRYSKQELKDKLQRSALHLVATEGIERLSTRRLSAGCGLSDPYIYQCYSDIPELLADTFLRVDCEVAELMRTVIGTQFIAPAKPVKLADVCRLLWDAYWRYLMEDPERTVFYWRYYQSGYYNRDILAVREKNYRVFTDFIVNTGKTLGLSDDAQRLAIVTMLIDDTVSAAVRITPGLYTEGCRQRGRYFLLRLFSATPQDRPADWNQRCSKSDACGGKPPMTEKELRKLNRYELLEMLLAQGKKLERLERELAEANERLAQRQQIVATSGTMAEAAMRLNRVFEAADSAAKEYLSNMELIANSLLDDARRKAARIIKDAEQQARIYSEHLEEQNDPQREYRQKGTADTFTGGTEW